MKILYSFEVPEKVVTKKPEIQKDAEGKDVEVLVSTEEIVPRKYAILKPQRDLQEDGELFFSLCYSKFLKLGLLTKAQIQNFSPLNEEDRKRIDEIYKNYLTKLKAYQAILLTPEKERTEEQENQIKTLKEELTVAGNRVEEHESLAASAYEQSAEVRSRNKCIVWWALHLALKDVEGKWEPLFKGKTYEEKLADCDRIEDLENPYLYSVVTKFIQYISFWYSGRANTPEEFAAVEEFLKSRL